MRKIFPQPPFPQPGGILAVIPIAAVLTFAGCSKGTSTTKLGSPTNSTQTAQITNGAAPAGASQPATASFAAAQVRETTASLNQTPQYALTVDDVALLQSQGVLAEGDTVALGTIQKQ